MRSKAYEYAWMYEGISIMPAPHAEGSYLYAVQEIRFPIIHGFESSSESYRSQSSGIPSFLCLSRPPGTLNRVPHLRPSVKWPPAYKTSSNPQQLALEARASKD